MPHACWTSLFTESAEKIGFIAKKKSRISDTWRQIKSKHVFEALFPGKFSRKQMRNIISGYVERKILLRTGTGPGTRYEISQEYAEKNKVMLKALQIGLQVLHERGEISILSSENIHEN